MEPCIIKLPNGAIDINPSALTELMANNCTMPDVDRIIYNIGKKAYPQIGEDGKKIKDKDGNCIYGPEVPVLATVVQFIDGTKVSVVNSQHDGVEFETKTLSDGTTVQVASKESKERGLIYALAKRFLSVPDRYGKMADSGISRILSELVDSAYDSQAARAEAKIRKAASKAKYEELKKNAKPKKPRYSIADTLARFNSILDKLEADPTTAKNVLDKVAAVFKD